MKTLQYTLFVLTSILYLGQHPIQATSNNSPFNLENQPGLNVEALARSLQTIQNQLDTITIKFNLSEERNRRLEQEAQERRIENKELKDYIQKVLKDNKELKDNIDKVLKDNIALKSKNTGLETDNQELKNKLSNLQQDSERKNSLIAELQNSQESSSGKLVLAAGGGVVVGLISAIAVVKQLTD